MVAGDEVRLVVAGLFHPIANDTSGQPAPPVKLQMASKNEMGRIGCYAAQQNDAEDADLVHGAVG